MSTMLANETRERTLRDLLEAVFRHKKKAMLFFGMVVVTTMGILAFTSGTYTSTAKLMIRRGREGVFLAPASSAAEVQPLYKEWESEINTELEILGSRELVIEVIQSLGSEAILAGPAPSRPGLLSPVRAVLNPVLRLFMKCRDLLTGPSEENQGGGGAGQLDRAIQVVEKNLWIEARKKSDIITVSYTAGSPELAREVVTSLVNIYLDRRIDVHKVQGAHQFFNQQTEQLLGELRATDESINVLKSKAGISSLEDSRRALQTSVETLRTQQLQNEAALATSSSRVATLRAILSQQTPADSSAKSGALLDRTEYQALQTTLRSEEITQTALIAGAREFQQQLAQLRRELADLNMLEAPVRKLQREQELLEEKYRKYSDNKEQARINEELETKKISNVSIVQHATLSEKANPSGKLFKLLAAVFLGMIGGVAIALGADALDPTLHSASDVSGRLHLPPLIELPTMHKAELYSLIGVSAGEDGPEARSLRLGRSLNKRVEECFQELLLKTLSLRDSGESGPFVIGVTSSSAGEGVSSIAANLAAAFARDDRFAGTLLLDASLQDLPGKLAEQIPAAAFAYQNTGEDQSRYEGKDKPIGVAKFIDQLERVKAQDHDVIVVDLPPVSEGGYTLRMAAAPDLVIMVVAAGHIPWRTALRAGGLLTDARAKLCGVVLNRRCFSMPEWLYRKL